MGKAIGSAVKGHAGYDTEDAIKDLFRATDGRIEAYASRDAQLYNVLSRLTKRVNPICRFTVKGGAAFVLTEAGRLALGM